jgi:hypothetical protein
MNGKTGKKKVSIDHLYVRDRLSLKIIFFARGASAAVKSMAYE